MSEAEDAFKSAAGMFREIGAVYWMAVTLAEHGEWLVEQHRTDEAVPLLEEANGIFERLGARTWSARATMAHLAPAVRAEFDEA